MHALQLGHEKLAAGTLVREAAPEEPRQRGNAAGGPYVAFAKSMFSQVKQEMALEQGVDKVNSKAVASRLGELWQALEQSEKDRWAAQLKGKGTFQRMSCHAVQLVSLLRAGFQAVLAHGALKTMHHGTCAQ